MSHIEHTPENNKYQKQWESFGSFQSILEQKFEDKYQTDITSILGSPNSMQAKAIKTIFATYSKKILELKMRSEEITSLEDVHFLFNRENRFLIPKNVELDIKQKYLDIIEKLTVDIPKIFLVEGDLSAYVKDGADFRIDKMMKLGNYIKLMSGLSENKREQLVSYIENPESPIPDFGIQEIETLGYLTNDFNYSSAQIVPSHTLDGFNRLTKDFVLNGVLNPIKLMHFEESEEGLTGLSRKTSHFVEVSPLSGSENSFSRDLSSEQLKYPNERGLRIFYKQNEGLISILSSESEMTNDNIEDFYRMRQEFQLLTFKTQSEFGFVPYDYGIFEHKLENISVSLSQNIDLETAPHRLKMIAFLDLCITWLDLKNESEDKEIINTLRKDILKGDYATFAEVGKSIKGTGGAEDIIEDFYDYLNKDIIQDYDGLSPLKEASDGNDTFLIDYEDYDSLIEQIGGGLGSSFTDLRLIMATDFVDTDTGTKSRELSMKLAEGIVLDKLTPEQIDSLIPKQAQVDAQVKTLKENVTDTMLIEALSSIPLAQKQQILLQNNVDFNGLSLRDIDTKVIKSMKQSILTTTATTQLLHENMSQKFAGGVGLSGSVEADFMKMYTSEYNERENMLSDGLGMILKEAAIFVIMTALTGVGGFMLTGSRIGGVALGAISKMQALAESSSLIRGVVQSSTVRAGYAATGFTIKRGAEAAMYTSISDIFYQGDQFTVDNFVQNFALFFGGVAGASIGGKFVKRSSGEFKRIAAQTFGGALGATGANSIVLMTNDRGPIGLESAGNMVLQGVLMGGLMLPIMRTSGKFMNKQKEAGLNTEAVQDWGAGKRATAISEGTSLNTGALEAHAGRVATRKQTISDVRDTAPFMKLGLTPAQRQKLTHKALLLKNINTSYTRDINTWVAEIERLTTQINKPGITAKQKKEFIANRKEIIKLKTKLEQQKRTLDRELDPYKDKKAPSENGEAPVSFQKIDSIASAAPISRMKAELGNTGGSLMQWYQGVSIRSKQLKLEALQRLDNTKQWNEIGDGFWLKNGNEVVGRDNKTLTTLPEGIKIDSIQYLGVGNMRIPVLHLNNGKALRIQESYHIQGGVPQHLVKKVMDTPSELSAIYDLNGGLIGFSLKVKGQKASIYKADGTLIKNIKLKDSGTVSKTVLSTRNKLSQSELIARGKDPIEHAKQIKKMEIAIKKAMNPEKIKQVKKEMLEEVEKIAKDPTVDPKMRSKAKMAYTYLLKMPLGFVSKIVFGSLKGILLLGTTAAAIDYIPDGEFDMGPALGAGASLFLTSDAGLSMIGSTVSILPGEVGEKGKSWFESIKKLKSKNKTLTFITQLASAIGVATYLED